LIFVGVADVVDIVDVVNAVDVVDVDFAHGSSAFTWYKFRGNPIEMIAGKA
jgi:hypothetical protein